MKRINLIQIIAILTILGIYILTFIYILGGSK